MARYFLCIAPVLVICGAALLGACDDRESSGTGDVARSPDELSLTPQQLSALSMHDPVRHGIDPTRLTDAQKAGMAANMRTLAVYGRARDMGDPALRARLADVRLPVLVVWGQSDRVVTPAYGRAVAAAFPNARLEILAECGHMPQVEQPERLLQLVASMG